MDYFHYHEGQLHAEDVPLEQIASQVGTPVYVYSSATLNRHYQVFEQSLNGLNHTICYAVKACSNIAILRLLARAGAGADIVSEGELRRVLAAGIAPQRIVFSGVGKTQAEMAFALETGIWQFNVESEPELRALSEVSASKGMNAPFALRINPDVDANTHAKISTGKKENKFGVSLEEAARLYALAATLPGLRVQGVSMHIGSQLTSLAPFREAYQRAAAFVGELRAAGHSIDVLDIGGGLGVPYEQSGTPPPPPDAYGQMVKQVLGTLGCHLVFEPGRLLVANAGVLLSRVIYIKQSGAHRFVIVDAAMNDLLRPALYEAAHELLPVRQSAADTPYAPADIVGPVCETGDLFARQTPLPPLTAGDAVIFRTAGAYGATMSGTYNSRLLVPEVLVDGARFDIIRPRPSYEAMLASEHIPDWLA